MLSTYFFTALIFIVEVLGVPAKRDLDGRAPLYHPGEEVRDDHYIVLFHEGYTLVEHLNFVGTDVTVLNDFKHYDLVGGYAAQLDEYTLTELVRKDPGVEYVEHSAVWELGRSVDEQDAIWLDDFHDSSDLLKERRATFEVDVEPKAGYGLVIVGGPQRRLSTPVSLGKYSFYHGAGQGVDAYVLDSGININHVLFQERATNFQGKESSPYTTPPFLPMDDVIGHGTRVAGVIGAARFGVAPFTNLINVKVTNAVNGKETRRCSNDNVIDAINAVTKVHIHKRVHGPAFRGSIINLSLEGPINSPAFQRTVTKAFNAGIVLVAGAGNSNVSASGAFPCAYDEVICVGSVNSKYQFSSSFSNYGPSVDILAPGELIFSSSVCGDGSNECIQVATGTSIATPFISGIIAIYSSWDPAFCNRAGATLMRTRLDKNLFKNGATGAPDDTTLNIGLTGMGNPFRPRTAPFLGAPFKPGANCGQGELRLLEDEEVNGDAAAAQATTVITETITSNIPLETESGDPSYIISLVPSSSSRRYHNSTRSCGGSSSSSSNAC